MYSLSACRGKVAYIYTPQTPLGESLMHGVSFMYSLKPKGVKVYFQILFKKNPERTTH